MKTGTLDYSDGNNTFEGYFAYDDSRADKRPCVIVCHAWAGLMDAEKEVCQRLTERGYVGFAADVFGKGVRGDALGDNSHLIGPFLSDRESLKHRLLLAVAEAAKHPMTDPNRMVAIGYCFGGLCVLDLARYNAPLKGVVSFHGIYGRPNNDEQPPIKVKTLILHGWDDPMAPPKDVVAVAAEFTKAKADWQLHAYGGTVHAFTARNRNEPEMGIAYNESADRRSWQAMCNFLDETFA